MSGNPLLSMMGNGGPMAMFQNSPIGQMISMMRNGQNPQALVQQMMNQNKDFGNLVNSLNGKDQSQINDIISKTAKERGVDLNQLAKEIGMPLEIAKNFGINL